MSQDEQPSNEAGKWVVKAGSIGQFIGEQKIEAGGKNQMVWSGLAGGSDPAALAEELRSLARAIREAGEPEDQAELAESAAECAEAKDASGVLDKLKSLGKKALELGEKIGVGLAVAALKQSLDL